MLGRHRYTQAFLRETILIYIGTTVIIHTISCNIHAIPLSKTADPSSSLLAHPANTLRIGLRSEILGISSHFWLHLVLRLRPTKRSDSSLQPFSKLPLIALITSRQEGEQFLNGNKYYAPAMYFKG